jgi:galactokinase/mevalonate kinase-like predicted kinase
VLGALDRACGLGWDTIDIYRAVLALEQLLTTGGGWQDQAGALFPGIKLVETAPGLAQTPSVRFVPERAFDTGASWLLYYTGVTRLAKNILAEIVSDMFLGRFETRVTLDFIKRNARDVYDAMQTHDAQRLAHAVARSWQFNKQLDPGTTTPEIEKILAGAKLLGAGGGGYLLIGAHDAAGAARIRARLEENPVNARARFVNFAVSPTGLEVSVS